MDRKEVNAELSDISSILEAAHARLNELAKHEKSLGKHGYMIDEARHELWLSAARLKAFIRHNGS
jgi:hypothetical protein